MQAVSQQNLNSGISDVQIEAADLHGESLSPGPVRNHDLEVAVRKVGAEIFICKRAAIRSFDSGEIPGLEDLSVYYHHISTLEGEFRQHNLSGPEIVVQDAIAEVHQLTRSWFRLFESGNNDFNTLMAASESYFQAIEPAYLKLNQLTVLSHLPRAAELKLSMVEFDTDFSGYCPEILTEIEQLEKKLLIDPALKRPQEGFGNILTVEQLTEILHRRQSRIFVAFQDGVASGFYLPVLNPDSVREYPGAHFDQLVDQGIIAADSRAGWVHITGTARENRVAMARAGVHLYKVFDQTMIQSAGSEGLDLLIGAVREGIYANTSARSHFRFGWEWTPHTFLGADGVTPYRTIIRRIAPEEKTGDAHKTIGWGSHFQVYSTSPAILESGIEGVRDRIGYAEARRRCVAYFGQDNLSIEVKSGSEYYGHCINIRHGGEHYASNGALLQIRPGIDYWRYLQGSGDRQIGSLDKLLPVVAVDLGVVSARRNMWLDD